MHYDHETLISDALPLTASTTEIITANAALQTRHYHKFQSYHNFLMIQNNQDFILFGDSYNILNYLFTRES